MYEMKDFEDAGLMLTYLNGLPPHEVVTCFFDNNRYWRVIVKVGPSVRLTETPEAPKKPRMVRPKGWKLGDPYVPQEEK